MSRIKALALMGMSDQDAQDPERLKAAKDILARIPPQHLAAEPGRLPNPWQLRDGWWDKDGLPEKERNGVLAETTAHLHPETRSAYGAFAQANPLIFRSVEKAVELSRKFADNYGGVDPQAAAEAIGALSRVTDAAGRVAEAAYMFSSQSFANQLMRVHARQYTRRKYISLVGDSLAAGRTLAAAEQELAPQAQRLAEFQAVVPASTDQALAEWYFGYGGRDPATDEFYSQNHAALARVHDRHRGELAGVLAMRKAGKAKDALMATAAASLEPDAFKDLLEAMGSGQHGQFFSGASLEEWGRVSREAARMRVLVSHLKSGDEGFADFMLATSGLSGQDAASVDAYLDHALLSQGSLTGLAARARAEGLGKEALASALDALSGFAAPQQPPPGGPPPGAAPQAMSSADAILGGVASMEDAVKRYFGENGDKAVEMMLDLADRNEDFRRGFSLADPQDRLPRRLMEEKVLPALASTQDSPQEPGRPREPGLQLVFFRHILSHAKDLELFSDQARIRRGVALAKTIRDRITMLGVPLPKDTDLSVPALSEAVLVKPAAPFSQLTDGSYAYKLVSATAEAWAENLESRGINASLYYRAMARCPETIPFLTSEEGVEAVRKLAGYRNSAGRNAGLADEYLFQLGQRGEKPARLGRMEAINVLIGLGDQGYFAQLGDISPKALIHPLLLMEADKTRLAVAELDKEKKDVRSTTAEVFAQILLSPSQAGAEAHEEEAGERTSGELRREAIWRIRGHVFVNPRNMLSEVVLPQEFRQFHQEANAQKIAEAALPYVREELVKAVTNSKDQSLPADELYALSMRHPILGRVYEGPNGRQMMEEDLRALVRGRLILNVTNPTLAEGYGLQGRLAFETQQTPWTRPHPNLREDILAERLQRIRADPQVMAAHKAVAYTVSNLPDHTVDNRSLAEYCVSRRAQMGLPDDEKNAGEAVQESLRALREAGVLSLSNINVHSVSQWALREVPASYARHLGADVFTRLYTMTNHGGGLNPAAAYHPNVAQFDEKIREAAEKQLGVGQKSGQELMNARTETRHAEAAARTVSNMHMRMIGVAKLEHIRHNVASEHNPSSPVDATDGQVKTAVEAMLKEVGVLYKTERGYYTLTKEDAPEALMRDAAARAHGKIAAETLRDDGTLRRMHAVVDFVLGFSFTQPHTVRLAHLMRVQEQVFEENRSAPVIDLPESPKQAAKAQETLIKAGVLEQVPGMEQGVYMISPAYMRTNALQASGD
jgi:hypothetical protein